MVVPVPHPIASALARAAARTPSSLSRRQLLAGMGALAGASLVAPRSMLGAAGSAPDWTKSAPRPLVGTAPRHLVWIWQFRHDGDPIEIRDRLAAHGLGVVLKTHDGSEWMSEYDKSEFGIYGPQAVADFARFFEDGGVPFHAWALVKGRKAEIEAQMAADVLSAGARSLFLDLEAHAGFWEGTDVAATIFGEQLRMKQPSARVSVSIDPRPWEIDRIPLTEFAAFSDEISPQAYWGFFNNNANAVKYRLAGSTIPDVGISPSFVVGTMMERLAEFGRPIHPIGDGTVTDGWGEFIQSSYELAAAESVSLWRYGVTNEETLALLGATPPRVASYLVQPGDTLGAIAGRLGISVSALAAANGLTNVNLLTVGQRLVLPGGAIVPGGQVVNPSPSTPAAPSTPPAEASGGSAARTFPPAPSWATPGASTGGTGGGVSAGRTFPPAPSWATPAATGGGTYTVEPGDSLLGIALRHGVTLNRLMSANGISNPNVIRIGQRLSIP